MCCCNTLLSSSSDRKAHSSPTQPADDMRVASYKHTTLNSSTKPHPMRLTSGFPLSTLHNHSGVSIFQISLNSRIVHNTSNIPLQIILRSHSDFKAEQPNKSQPFHTSSCPSMPSSVVVMFLRMAGSTFDPAPWMTKRKAWSIVSLDEDRGSTMVMQGITQRIH